MLLCSNAAASSENRGKEKRETGGREWSLGKGMGQPERTGREDQTGARAEVCVCQCQGWNYLVRLGENGGIAGLHKRERKRWKKRKGQRGKGEGGRKKKMSC